MYDNQELIKALEHIDPAQLSYQEWLDMGMALKSEGLDVNVWDSWSQRDTNRHKPGECEQKWPTFDSAKVGGVTGGTIFHVAESRFGYVREKDAGQALDWNDTAQTVDPKPALAPSSSTAAAAVDHIKLPTFERLPNPTALDPLDLDPAEQLRAYTRALFLPGEYVNVVTETFVTKDGRAFPHGFGIPFSPDHLYCNADAVLEDCSAETGAWVRINPVISMDERDAKTDEQEIAYSEGRTAKRPDKAYVDDDVTAWRYALVESDNLPQDEQLDMILRLHLPCAAIVDSGGKSVHAIVRVDASDAKQHAERTRALYDYCSNNGLTVDTSCSNPSRLSRLPGATRGGRIQRLMGVSVGPRSWDEFVQAAQELAWDEPAEEEGQPDLFDKLDAALKSTELLTGENRLPRPPFVVEGMVPEGAIAMVAAPPKCGKTYFLMQMAQALADGRSFLEVFPCRRSRVLYVNVEVDERWASQRIDDIRIATNGTEHYREITLRGELFSRLRDLKKWLIERHSGEFDVIILDPLYLFIEGDENKAEVMTPLMVELKGLRDACCCTLLFAAHFQKYFYNHLPAARPAGSGVLHRFIDIGIIITPRYIPDAGIDRECLEDYARMARNHKAYASEMYLTARNDSDSGEEVNTIIFASPLFHADKSGQLDHLPIAGSKEAATLEKPSKQDKIETERSKKDLATGRAIEACKAADMPPTRANVLKYLPKECEKLGINAPKIDAFKDWTKRNGPTHYRVDPLRGNELHPIDLDQIDDDGNAPFLPTEEEVLASDGKPAVTLV